MNVSMIAAMGRNRVIGKDNDLPWRLPDDFKYFQETTKGHFVIMGRKNWESLPHKFRPLPGRLNAVITRTKDYPANGALVFNTLQSALKSEKEKGGQEVFIIGGGEIYRIALPHADRIYLTEIDGEFEGTVTFPVFSKKEWTEVSRKHHEKDERHAFRFDFVIYEKKARQRLKDINTTAARKEPDKKLLNTTTKKN